MSEQLKPCPFCGAKPHRQLGKVWHDSLHGDAHQDTVIKCPHLCVTMMGSSNGVVERWNTRAAPATQWQPIETAPRDGTVVMLLDDTVCAPGAYQDGNWYFWEGELAYSDYAEFGDLNGWVKGYGPSHWMPLPQPPEAQT